MSVLDSFKHIRNHSAELCKNLLVEDFGIQAAEFVSPPKWHLAHTTWFFETFILLPNVKDYTVFNPNFNFLFNSYYNNVGERILQNNRGNMSRPSTDEIFAYRSYVDEKMQNFLQGEHDKKILDLVKKQDLNFQVSHEEFFLIKKTLVL